MTLIGPGASTKDLRHYLGGSNGTGLRSVGPQSILQRISTITTISIELDVEEGVEVHLPRAGFR